jgi:hypothetical protein
MPPVGFEPTISAGERPQTYAFALCVETNSQLRQNRPETKVCTAFLPLVYDQTHL